MSETQGEQPGKADARHLGPYVLLDEAGRGGTSLVYKAEDPRLGRTVAIKVLAVPPTMPAAARDEMVARFVREARAIAHLSHPNIVTIYDVGEQDGAHYLVMEYLEGRTLGTLIQAGPVSPTKAQRILSQVAEAIDAVHARGIVHRDIKPVNVMVDAGGHVKLMDFGIARQHDDTVVTQTGALVGSPSYLSPELIRGENFTPGSDIWSLGVLLYEMLAGKPPFGGATLPAVLYQVSHDAPTPLPAVSPATQGVLDRALHKDAASRFQSARALAAAFGASLESSAPSSLLTARASPVLVPRAATVSPPPIAPPSQPAIRPRPRIARFFLPRLPRFVWPAALLVYFAALGSWFVARSQVAPPKKSSAAPTVRVKSSRQSQTRFFPSPPGPRSPAVTVTPKARPAPRASRRLRTKNGTKNAPRVRVRTPKRSEKSRREGEQKRPEQDYERILPTNG